MSRNVREREDAGSVGAGREGSGGGGGETVWLSPHSPTQWQCVQRTPAEQGEQVSGRGGVPGEAPFYLMVFLCFARMF